MPASFFKPLELRLGSMEVNLTRLIGEVSYALLGAFPRPYAEGLKARLEAARIPAVLQTPFDLPEVYLAYTGDVSLWVPEALVSQAELLLASDQISGEAP